MKPQTIQIFLPDGSPISIREAEITNRLVKAILFPRAKMDEVSKRETIHFTGMYFLFGMDEESGIPMVYIGEGEDCFKRIQTHNRSKDFWTHCVIITTKTNEYTKTDVKYLEHYCLAEADKIGRFKNENGKDSQRPSIPETREHDLLDNFETMKILLATLGYPIFEEKRKDRNREIFYIKSKGIEASGEMTDEGFLIHKQSTAVVSETKNVRSWITSSREALIRQGIIGANEVNYLFISDHLFASPSAASSVILGRSSNGWTSWKNKDGKTLDELKRK